MLEQVKRAIELVKKSLEIINQRLDNLKTMIRCNTERIDLIRQGHWKSVTKWEQANQRIRQRERTVEMLNKVHKDTVKRHHKEIEKKYGYNEEWNRVSGDPFNEDNIPSDPDDGSWVGR